jgi:hypothetical protein
MTKKEKIGVSAAVVILLILFSVSWIRSGKNEPSSPRLSKDGLYEVVYIQIDTYEGKRPFVHFGLREKGGRYIERDPASVPKVHTNRKIKVDNL